MSRHRAALVGTTAFALILAGMLMPGSASGLRQTNAEIRIISQSGFQAEIEPCG